MITPMLDNKQKFVVALCVGNHYVAMIVFNFLVLHMMISWPLVNISEKNLCCEL